MNILIIEDDFLYWNKIKSTFEKKQLINNVKIIKSYNELLYEKSMIKNYDVFLVDIMLGQSKKNGIDVVEDIRKENKKASVIILSWLDDISWLEKGFIKWADDYLIKPFRLKELELRVFTHFKNSCIREKEIKKKHKAYNGLEYVLNENSFYYNWKILDLTKQNKYLLKIFLSNPEKLIQENHLIERLWLDLSSVVNRNIRISILRLKQALKPYGIDNWISNVRWQWYILKKS